MSVPPEVYVFALCTAVFWGLQPVMIKRGVEHGGASALAVVVAALFSIGLFLSAVQLLSGVPDAYAGLPLWVLATFFIGGFVGTGLGRLALFSGVNRVGASITSAVVNTRPLFASVFAFALLGEPLTAVLAGGIVVITAGVIVISLSRGGDVRGWRSRELLFPLTSAVAYASGNVIRRFGFTATDLSPLPAILLNEVGGITLVLGYVLARHTGDVFRAPRRAYGYFLLAGVFSAGGLASMFAALSLGPVVVVDPLSGTAPLFAAVFAYVLLRDVESVTRGVVLGAALVVAGIALVAVG